MGTLLPKEYPLLLAPSDSHPRSHAIDLVVQVWIANSFKIDLGQSRVVKTFKRVRSHIDLIDFRAMSFQYMKHV